jgi:hypothetical protein
VYAQRTAVLLFLAVLAVAPGRAVGQQPATLLTLREVDRATVRIVALRGIGLGAGERGPRSVAEWRHGSGVFVGPRAVLTARHVVEGAGLVGVIFPERGDLHRARVVHVDPDHDIAFLRVETPSHEFVPLPERPPPLSAAQPISVTGYPLDISEVRPAAVSGEISRLTNRGLIQADIAVPPGHSGGPATDARGRLIGIASARRTDAEGIAFLVPIAAAIEAWSSGVRARIREEREPLPLRRCAVGAAVIDLIARTGGLMPPTTPSGPVGCEDDSVTPEEAVVVAVSTWELRQDIAARDALSRDDREDVSWLDREARRLVERAVADAPSLSVRYPVIRALGFVVP